MEANCEGKFSNLAYYAIYFLSKQNKNTSSKPIIIMCRWKKKNLNEYFYPGWISTA